MKKYFLHIILAAALFTACKKDDIYQYNNELDNISLNYLDNEGNSDTSLITYSFALSPGLASDTLWVPVTVAGKRVPFDRKFVLAVVDTLTNAQEGLHYEPLNPFYTMPADSGKIEIPLILKNTDPELTNKSVILSIRVMEGGDFAASLPSELRSKSIVYSNRLEEPEWWEWWLGNLGPYSRTAHRLFLISGGQALTNVRAPNGFLGIPRTLYYLENARNLTRDPFTWVARFPEKGYVLTKRSDGTEDYDFYHVEAPTIKMHLKFFPQLNSYFFISENGNQIIMN